ncbi:MAG: nicotinamide riboside transporter PnuC [Gammaproteobacteria bacterium]
MPFVAPGGVGSRAGSARAFSSRSRGRRSCRCRRAFRCTTSAWRCTGFWHWSREDGAPKGVTTWPLRAHLISWVVIVALSALTSRYLATETQAAWPFLDSLTTWGSLLATWLTAQVKLENWLYWIVFDAISVFLFVAQGLMFVALLMLIYLVIASLGFVSWSRSRRAPVPSG